MKVEQPPVTLKEHLFPTICIECGQPFMSDLEKMCETCILIKSCEELLISEKINVCYCRFCEAYKGRHWTYCEVGSLEFMEMMMKEVRCSEKVKIISVSYEINESSIKLKGRIERKLPKKMKNLQNFVIDCYLQESECDSCQKIKFENKFKAIVKIQQEFGHHKTFFYLEQLIIKHQKHKKMMKVEIDKEGINFYYQNSTHAKELISFLEENLPVSISYLKNVCSSENVKHLSVFEVKIPNVRRNDLLHLPVKLSKELGCSPIVICSSVKEKIHLTDVENYQSVVMSSIQYEYYEGEIKTISFAQHAQQFTIFSCELNRKTHKNMSPKLFHYLISHQEDWENFNVQGNLGYIPAGSIVKGFDLAVLKEKEELEINKPSQNIILVEKCKKKKNDKRIFILKRLENFGVLFTNKLLNLHNNMDEEINYFDEFERFLDEIEVSSNLRKEINLYKNHASKVETQTNLGEIELCELLEELTLEEKLNNDKNALREELEGISELIQNFDKIHL